MKQVERTVAATSESSQLRLSNSSPGCSETQPDHKRVEGQRGVVLEAQPVKQQREKSKG